MRTRFPSLFVLAVSIAFLMLFGTPDNARAETLIYTDTTPFGNLGDGVNLTLPKFDPELGILVRVEISATSFISGTGGYENRDGNPLTIQFTVDVATLMTLPNLDQVGDARRVISTTDIVGGFDNFIDFQGTSGKTYTYTGSLHTGKTLLYGADFSQFIGLNNLLAVFTMTGASVAQGSPRVSTDLYVDGVVVAEVLYEYVVPRIELEKFTNNRVADGSNDPDVPQINPGDLVVWTYLVTNTGTISIPLANVTVTDDQPGVIPVRDTSSDVGQDAILAPGETWRYQASTTAPNLQTPPPNTTTVPGCQPAGAVIPGTRNTYRNIGTVIVPAVTITDPSHYCNPPLPAIALTKYTNGHDADVPTGPLIPLGGIVTWTYLITNTGNTPLINVSLSDDRIGAITCPKSELAIGESMLCSATGIATPGQYANIGTVTGNVPPGWPTPANPIQATNPSHYFGNGFDLALRKLLAPGQTSDIKRGDLVRFTITVFNQGTITATAIRVVDYYPTGFTLADANWRDQGSYAERTIAGPLLPGRSTSVDIILRVPENPVPGTFINTAEIASANDVNGQVGEDYDSAPDSDPNNDGTIKNDEIDEHRSQDPAADEDDHDIEPLVVGAYADLALRKTLAPGQSAVVKAGDLVKFTITVFNQGSLTAHDVIVTDYIPVGLQLADANWQAGPNNSASRTIANPLAAGASTSLEITVRVLVDAPGQGYINYAEISQMLGGNGQPLIDEDSTLDANPNNDGNVKNDEINEDHKANSVADEDDHDLEAIHTRDVFDLALRKTLAVGQSATVRPGDLVNFVITVYNQGTIAATNVEVSDHIPAGFHLADPNWQLVGDVAKIVVAGPIPPGGFVALNLALRINAGVTGGTLINIAEISQSSGPNGQVVIDEDSTPDGNSNNDGTPKNDVVDEDHKTNPGEDEDDHDIEPIVIGNYADLALRKTLAPGQSADVKRNELVKYTITIYNQGTIAATNIRVFDYYPPGFTLADPNWSDSGTYATRLVAGPIEPGQSTSVEITLRVPSSPVPGSFINTAEIGAFSNANGQLISDYDSAPDGDSVNDGTIKNDVIDEHRLQDPDADEDDHDIEPVRVDQYADLALRKVLATGQSPEVSRGDLIKFTILVFNQGSIAISNIQVTDYIPASLELADATWQAGLDNTATRLIPGPLAPGASTSVDIVLRVLPTALAQSYLNLAEISRMTDGNNQPIVDEDSTQDGDRGNDGDIKNDEINQDHKADPTTDEDDHDLEPLRVRDYFDLALRKTLAVGQSSSVQLGARVRFVVTVYNQGTLTATNVEVTDYIPTGLRLVDPNWERINSNMARRKLTEPIPPGGFVAVTIILEVETDQNIALINFAEISKATGPNQEAIVDEDSTPDAIANNDGTPKNDVIYEDRLANSNADEDDHDPEPITIKKATDLDQGSEPTDMSKRVFMPIVLR